jgi:hypothetical protein
MIVEDKRQEEEANKKKVDDSEKAKNGQLGLLLQEEEPPLELRGQTSSDQSLNPRKRLACDTNNKLLQVIHEDHDEAKQSEK